MQSKDDEGAIVFAKVLKERHELEKSLAESKSAGATQHTIGELPHRGDVVEIRGLKFKVQSVDYKRQEIRLALVTPD